MDEKTAVEGELLIRTGIPPNTIFIGQKPTMTYVTAKHGAIDEN